MALVSLIDLALHTEVADPPMGHNFAVQIDSIATVQMWTSVNGLGLSLSTAGSRPGHGAAGGGGGKHLHRAGQSGQTTGGGGSLTLTRPLGPASKHIYDWVDRANTQAPTAKTVVLPTTTGQVRPTNGCVLLVDRTSLMLYEWDLTGITPVSWTISQLDASKSEVVTETLKLNFTGIQFDITLLGA